MFEDFRPSKSIETSSSTWSSRSDTWVKSTHNSALPASAHHLFWGMILSFFFALNHERITWFPKSCGVSLTKLFSSFHYQQNDTTTLQFNVTNGRFFFETSLTANRWGLAAINKKSHCFAHPSCMEVVQKTHWPSTSSDPKLTASPSLIPICSKDFKESIFQAQHWPWGPWASFLEWFCTIRKHKNHFCFSGPETNTLESIGV